MKRSIFIALVLLLAAPFSAMASEITVAAAANVQFTLEELKAEFTKETGIDVKSVIGASGKLTSQIENGAPFDVFLSADMKYPAKVFKDGFSDQEPKIYVYGSLVLWTMRDIDLSAGIGILGGVQKIALANPEVAPYGREAVNAMKFYKIYDRLQSKLVYGESISQANQFIKTGAADIGFTAKSVVLSPNMMNKGRWIEVDPLSYSPIAQGVVVLKYGHQNHSKEAQAFDDFLFSAPAQGIFKKYGYRLP